MAFSLWRKCRGEGGVKNREAGGRCRVTKRVAAELHCKIVGEEDRERKGSPRVQL